MGISKRIAIFDFSVTYIYVIQIATILKLHPGIAQFMNRINSTLLQHFCNALYIQKWWTRINHKPSCNGSINVSALQHPFSCKELVEILNKKKKNAYRNRVVPLESKETSPAHWACPKEAGAHYAPVGAQPSFKNCPSAPFLKKSGSLLSLVLWRIYPQLRWQS